MRKLFCVVPPLGQAVWYIRSQCMIQCNPLNINCVQCIAVLTGVPDPWDGPGFVIVKRLEKSAEKHFCQRKFCVQMNRINFLGFTYLDD